MEQCPRCETCKHWEQKSQLEDLNRWERLLAEGWWAARPESRPFREADAEFGNCDILSESGEIKGQDWLDSTWVPLLQTHKAFGCTLHEHK